MRWERLKTEILVKGEWKVVPNEVKQFMKIRRAKIPGGWLVRGDMMAKEWKQDQTDITNESWAWGWGWGYGMGGLTFVPDPNHEWDGDSLD